MPLYGSLLGREVNSDGSPSRGIHTVGPVCISLYYLCGPASHCCIPGTVSLAEFYRKRSSRVCKFCSKQKRFCYIVWRFVKVQPWEEPLKYHSVIVRLFGKWRIVKEDMCSIRHHLVINLKTGQKYSDLWNLANHKRDEITFEQHDH